MSEVTSPPRNGTPSWMDLMTTDREAALAFYGPVLGWEFQVGSPESGYYTMATVNGLTVAGIGQQQPDAQGAPAAWTTYIAVDDVDATVDKVKNAGGTVLMDPMDVFTEGRMAIAADPTGAVFGMWQAGDTYGARLVNEPGAQCWNEAVTRDPATAAEFYRAVFGYEVDRMPGDFEYLTLRLGDDVVAGVMGVGDRFPAETPAHWVGYFAVADADATAQALTRAGGRVLDGPSDSEFGRMATVSDPQGAVFSIIALAPPPDHDT